MPGFSALQRRHDLDWLRVAALGLLILTHVLYVYRIAPWRVHSEHNGLWADLLVEALAPWRISLVFFIAGAATRFMLERKSLVAFLQNRFLRLGVPLLMAVIVLVPPMLYATDPHANGHNYVQFVFDHSLHIRNVLGAWVPDLGHVWFLPYLLAYSALVGLVWCCAPNQFRDASNAVARAPILLIMCGLAAMFVVSDVLLKPVFGRTDMFLDDPAGHVRCIPPFLLGVMLVRADGFWKRLVASGRWLYPAALGLCAISIALSASNLIAGEAVALLAVLAFGAAYLQRESPAQHYLGDAIMPVYLLHQPMIVWGEVWLASASLPLGLEFPLVLASASLVPLAVYHFLIRPLPPLRILFGLKAEAPPSGKPSLPPGAAGAGRAG